MTGRAQNILRRLPAHLDVAREGKQIAEVTTALAQDLDTLSVVLARIRRAHRLLDADELRDLLRIAALHHIIPAEFAILFTRFAEARKLLPAAAVADDAAEKLIALWGIAAPAPRLPLFGDRPALGAFAARALLQDALLDALRARIRTICTTHARGNGTVQALASGAANALDLDIQSITHSTDRYLHIAVVKDRLRLRHPVPQGAATVEQDMAPAAEELLLEENPLAQAKTGDVGRKHAELFSVLRRGFETATIEVRVTGVENRTLGPMLVNRDEGRGVGFSGAVPSGSTLDFTEEGRVLLDSNDVTSLCFGWKGGCFADSAAIRPLLDFVFDGPGADPARVARFAESTPSGALESSFVFPHAGDSLTMPGISVGETRFAFFVQEGYFSKDSQRVAPRPAIAFADQSVFAPGPSETRPNAAMVALQWHERAAFCVNVWIPRRFLGLTPEDAEGRDTLSRVALAVNRFRPAGVQVNVFFLDNRWVLGRGVMPPEIPAEGAVTGPGTGSELWSVA